VIREVLPWLTVVAVLSGCATAPNYQGVSFNSFVDRIEGKDAPAPSIWSAARVKISQKNATEVSRSFINWCRENGGAPQYDFGVDIREVRWKPQGTVGCRALAGQNIAGFSGFEGGVLAFYSQTEMDALHSRSEREIAIQDRKISEAYAQKVECRERKQAEILKNLKIGTETLQGLVVAVNRPLAQVQTVSPQGVMVQWIPISSLNPPYNAKCN